MNRTMTKMSEMRGELLEEQGNWMNELRKAGPYKIQSPAPQKRKKDQHQDVPKVTVTQTSTELEQLETVQSQEFTDGQSIET